MIEAINLTKKFGNFVAVNHVNLQVHAGELFGFLGPNGAGKTTTIKMLVGLLRPSEGYVRIGGYDMGRNAIAAKSILGYLPAEATVYDKLTGREFLRFVADIYNVDRKRAGRRIEDLLHLFDLTDAGDQLMQAYSLGMRQKIALAGALIHDPKVFFLDEPTLGLDPKSARLIKDILRELASRGTCVFLTTHILEIAERMCDRVAIIRQGEIIAQGTMADLRAQAGAHVSTGQNEPQTLEDIFLQLTGGSEYAELARYLQDSAPESTQK
jgi:ABC-2 type transport system ATP-binding protein